MAVIFHPIRSILLLLLIAPTLSAEKFGPWDLDALKSQVPATTWLRMDQTVHSLTYSGESVKQKPTDVFAFYASPRTLGVAAPNAKFPGVVLIHGGGGTAFAEWVHLCAGGDLKAG